MFSFPIKKHALKQDMQQSLYSSLLKEAAGDHMNWVAADVSLKELHPPFIL